MHDVRTAMRNAATFNSHRTAVISQGRSLSYAQAWDRGLRFAQALISLGARPGDRIAVLEDNCLASSDFFLATAISNTVRVPLYKRNSRESHAHMLRESGCRIAVVNADQVDELAGLESEIDSLRHVIVRDGDYEAWLNGFPATDPELDISLDDFYVIRHSAGTTGIPKGVAFTHLAWMNTERNWTYALPPLIRGDHAVHVGPISHGSGYLFLPIWLAGGCNVLEPRFDGERLMELMSDVGGYVFGVPTMLSDLVERHPDPSHDLSRLKAFVVSGAPIDRKTILAARDLLGPKLFQLYGQTECVPGAMIGPEEWFSEIDGSDPLASAGRVLPYVEIEIRGERNEPLAIGDIGEIALRSDGQVSTFWGDPQLTAERVVDGWVLTGDIGRLDENGFLYLHDRKNELIISGGFNIWPAELEKVIFDLPGVREVVVFGIPDERWGETPHAIVVVDEESTLSADAVVQTCSVRLGSYKKPDSVRMQHDALPRTPLGKISRKQLRDSYQQELAFRTQSRWVSDRSERPEGGNRG
jgi:acyl-CoA synthetase (AMP-forming)/AMP-acid ligase II